MNRIKSVTIALSLLLLSANATFAQTVESIEIVEFGIYDKREPGNKGTGTEQAELGGLILRKQTDQIPASVGTSFGVTYIATGTPDGAPVEISFVTLFPPAGIIASSGRRIQKEETTRSTLVGLADHRLFEFNAPWRMIPGDWVFEFYYDGRKLAEQHFKVIDPAK
jgi:hypothetical protein